MRVTKKLIIFVTLVIHISRWGLNPTYLMTQETDTLRPMAARHGIMSRQGNFAQLGWDKYINAEKNFVERYAEILLEKKRVANLSEADLRDLNNFASCIPKILKIKDIVRGNITVEVYRRIADFLSEYGIDAVVYPSKIWAVGYLVLAEVPFILDIEASYFEENIDAGILLLPYEDFLTEYKTRKKRISEDVFSANDRSPDKIIATYGVYSKADEIYDKDLTLLQVDRVSKKAKIYLYVRHKDKPAKSRAIASVVKALAEFETSLKSILPYLETAEADLRDIPNRDASASSETYPEDAENPPSPEEMGLLYEEMTRAILNNYEGWISKGRIYFMHGAMIHEFIKAHPQEYPIASKYPDRFSALSGAESQYMLEYECAHMAVIDAFIETYKDRYPLICKYIRYYIAKIKNQQALVLPENALGVIWFRVFCGYSLHFEHLAPPVMFTQDTMDALDETLPYWHMLLRLYDSLGKEGKYGLMDKIGRQGLYSLDYIAYMNDPDKIRSFTEKVKLILMEYSPPQEAVRWHPSQQIISKNIDDAA